MISASSAESSISRIDVISLRDHSFITLLRYFKSVLKTSVGPNGHIKLLVSGGGYVQPASSSSQIVQHFSDQFNSPIIQFIAQIMKGQSDFGLYSGLIITTGLEHSLSLQVNNSVTNKQSTNIFNTLLKKCNEIFTTDRLKIRVNFDTISDFIPLVRSILSSKCNTFLTSDLLTDFSLQIVKSFLCTLDVNRMMSGKIITNVYKGNEECKFCAGVVYQLTDDDSWIVDILQRNENKEEQLKSILFTTALDYELETKSHDFDDLKHFRMIRIFEILEKAISLGVNLIVCQKVVHTDVLLYLRRKSVIILNRLGTNLANNFEQLSGSFPISDIDKLPTNDISSMVGAIDDISTFSFGNNVYVSMCCESTHIGTLLLKMPCIGGTQRIQVLVEQALRGLRALITEPAVCPGAGCFETCLFVYLQELCKEEIPSLDTKWLLTMLLEAAGCSLPIWIDTNYYHAWSIEDQLKCNCQVISKNMVSANGGSFYSYSSFDELSNIGNKLLVKTSDRNCLTLPSNAIVDSFVLKRNSVVVSFESCINVLNIGTVVYRKVC